MTASAPLTWWRRRGFPHGVHMDDHKSATCNLPIRPFPFAPELVLPLGQHAGKPSLPVVREQDEVVRGQVIAVADGFRSVPLHAPAGFIPELEVMIIVQTLKRDHGGRSRRPGLPGPMTESGNLSRS